MKSGLRILMVFGVIFAVIASCRKKDDDESIPVVRIEEPFDGQVFAYGDTIFIRAKFSHSRSITSIKVSLVNGTQTPVLPALNFEVSDNNYLLVTYLVLDEVQMTDGKYTLQLKVSDENASWNNWVEIQYIEAEKELISLIAVVKTGMSSFDVLEAPLNNNTSKLFSFTGDFLGSALNQGYNTLNIAGRFINGLSAWDLNETRMLWNVPAVLIPAQAWIYAMFADGDEVFISNRDGYLRGYDPLGQVTFRSLKMENGNFTNILKSKEKLLGVFEPYNGKFSELVVFNYPGGTLFRKMQMTGEVIYMSNYLRDAVLIFVNQPDRAAVYEYSVTNHTLVELKTFPFNTIQNVTGNGKDHYFLHSGEDIWWYRPAVNSATKYVQAETGALMAFEALNNRLYVGSGHNIASYNLPFNEPVYNLELPFPLVSFNLRYNK